MRVLYIVAYDIADQSRLNRVRLFLKGFSVGGQKSVYECYLSPPEVREVKRGLENLIVHEEDRVYCFCLDLRSRVHPLGKAVPPKYPEFYFFG